MKLRLGTIAALLSLTLTFAGHAQEPPRLFVPMGKAGPLPEYLVLRLPKAPPESKASPSYYLGRKRVVSTHGYAYGWFGVPQRRHLSRHHGFYRHHTQWSSR